MHKLICLSIFYIQTIFCFGQHTERYDSFALKLKPIDTVQINIKFKNGKTKEIGTVLEYDYDGYIYSFYSGKLIKYYKNGQIRGEIYCDSFGCELSSKYYDLNGYLLSHSITQKIDTKASQIEEFLDIKKYSLVYSHDKRYIYSMNLDDIYLSTEGNTLNNKKYGVWEKYDRNGELKKKIKHKE